MCAIVLPSHSSFHHSAFHHRATSKIYFRLTFTLFLHSSPLSLYLFRCHRDLAPLPSPCALLIPIIGHQVHIARVVVPFSAIMCFHIHWSMDSMQASTDYMWFKSSLDNFDHAKPFLNMMSWKLRERETCEGVRLAKE